MKKSICKKTTLVVTLILVLASFNGTLSHAIEFDKYGIVEEYVAMKWIDSSTYNEVVIIGNEKVTYFYGNNFTVVKDSRGFSIINFYENGKIRVNGTEVESRIVHLKNDILDNQYRTNTTNWVLYDTVSREYNVIGLAPSIIGGVIGGTVGAKIGNILGQVFSIVSGAVVGTYLGGHFPEYYISVRTDKYYKTPIVTSRTETKTVQTVYHGPKYDRYQYYWFTM